MSAGQTLYDLVVVGSSAGGIEALSLLVSTLPTDFPIPLVLAQHLGPDRPRPAQPSGRYSCASESTASAFQTCDGEYDMAVVREGIMASADTIRQARQRVGRWRDLLWESVLDEFAERDAHRGRSSPGGHTCSANARDLRRVDSRRRGGLAASGWSGAPRLGVGLSSCAQYLDGGHPVSNRDGRLIWRRGTLVVRYVRGDKPGMKG
jgi:CheB methylesterase